MHFHLQAAQFLFQDPKNYLLFASPVLRDACIKKTTEELHTCTETQYILFTELQNYLCMHIAYSLEMPLRTLTFVERASMYEAFLLQKDIQHAIMRLEKCFDTSESENTLEQKYASKLEKILVHYSLICELKQKNDAPSRETYENVHFIVTRYYDFVLNLGYIDYACATIALCEKYDACAAKTSQSFWNNILVCSPSFFPISQNVWLTHFNDVFKDSLRYEKTPSHRSPIENTEKTHSLSLQKPQCTQHIVFANIAEELNWACSTALGLQQNGIAAQEIAFSISSIDDFILSELISLSAKYELTFNMQYMQNTSHCTTLHIFLKNIEACINANMHPSTLKNLLLFPSIPWKNRVLNIELIALGFKRNCIDNAEMEQWTEALNNSKNKILKGYFFSLYNALRAILRAQTYEKLQTAFYHFAHSFMNINKTHNSEPSFGKRMIERIFGIIKELTLQERYVQHTKENMHTTFKTKNTWAVLCSIALRRMTKHPKNENAIFVCEFPESLGTSYKHHFFLNLSQEGLKKASAPPILFHEFTDLQIFENTYRGYQSEMAAQYKAAIDNGGTNVYISTSREGYTRMRIIPTEWNFIDYVKDTAKENSPVLFHDPWSHELQIWNTDLLCEKELMQWHITKLQQQGMQTQQHTKRNNTAGMLRNSLHASTKKIIRENFEEGVIPISSISTLMADPIYFLLKNVFSVTALFEDIQENLQMPIMLGSAFHAVLARIFSPESDSEPVIIQKALQSLEMNTHVLVNMTLQRIFQNEEMYQYIAHIREFLTDTMQSKKCTQIKSEETTECFLHEIFEWADGVFSKLRIKGRSDALFYNTENHVQYIVDYKTKLKTPLSYFAQLWMYAALHMNIEKASETDGAPYALFLLLKNLHKSKEEKPIDFRIPREKEKLHIQKYKALLRHSLASIFCKTEEVQNIYTAQDITYATQAALTKELYEDIAYACITRNHCYMYQNYISRHSIFRENDELK